jgi:hypothetical protein
VACVFVAVGVVGGTGFDHNRIRVTPVISTPPKPTLANSMIVKFGGRGDRLPRELARAGAGPPASASAISSAPTIVATRARGD